MEAGNCRDSKRIEVDEEDKKKKRRRSRYLSVEKTLPHDLENPYPSLKLQANLREKLANHSLDANKELVY